jgi:hypothetical protein
LAPTALNGAGARSLRPSNILALGVCLAAPALCSRWCLAAHSCRPSSLHLARSVQLFRLSYLAQPTLLVLLTSAHMAQFTRLSLLGSARTLSYPGPVLCPAATLSYARPLRPWNRSGVRSRPVQSLSRSGAHGLSLSNCSIIPALSSPAPGTRPHRLPFSTLNGSVLSGV